MNMMMPDGTDKQDDDGAVILAFPGTCAEHLGAAWGTCQAPGTNKINGRHFCDYHHSERLNFYARPTRGRA